jgi:hypothetical protein
MIVKPGQILFVEPSGNCTAGTVEDGSDTRVYSSEEAIHQAFRDGGVEDDYIFIEVEVKRIIKVEADMKLVPFVAKKKR